MADRGEHRQSVERPSAPRVTVAVLGPTTVTVDGDEGTITARRQRAVLACLALHPDEPLSADRLLDEVWGDDLPETGARAVAHQIAKLRTVLEPERTSEGHLIMTTDAGYTFHIAPDDVDAIAFDHLVTAARDALLTDPARAQSIVGDALGLWRGRPFADLADEPFVERETRRLEHHHLLARRTLAEARIALGRHTEVIGELESLVAEHPVEESFVHLLMTALHRSGRTADALRAYADLRRRLSAELGIEPSHELQRLEQQLLIEDPRTSTSIPGSGPRPRPIPAPLTTLVGRTEELAEIEELLVSTRLVTLVGFGGLGKTRLAQETARTIGDRFRDGIWYVDLTPITDPAVLADTIVAAGGLTVPQGRDPVEHLLVRIADRDALIVLDNCEHLVDDVAGLVTRIVRAAPDVRVLATSRTPLGIADETLRPVRPLDVESASDLLTARARLTRPGFAVDDTNRGAIERLIQALDGIPLAIEMVAARLAVMSVDQIVEHLDDRFHLLTHTQTHTKSDERQRSIEAVLAWSCDLLEEQDQELLRRMSVCAGGFDLEAAVAIGVREPSTASLDDVLDRLARLVEASLVLFDENGGPRYRMLETVRQFAAAWLGDDEARLAGGAHARFYASVAVLVSVLAAPDPSVAIPLGDRELGNLRAAMSWAFRNGEPRLGLSIALDSRSYFATKALNRELVRWLRTGLELIDGDDDLTRLAAACAVVEAGNSFDRESEQFAVARVERGLGTVDDPRVEAELLNALGASAAWTDPQRAKAYVEAAIALNASTPERTAAFLHNLVLDSWSTGDLGDGDAILRRFDDTLRCVPRARPMRQLHHALVASCVGRWADVVRIAESDHGVAAAWEVFLQMVHAEALAGLGRLEEALDTIDRLNPDVTALIDHLYVELVHASIDLRRDEPEAAARRLSALADEVARDGRRLAIGMHIAALLAAAAHDLGQPDTAAVLFGYAAAEQERLDIVLRPSCRPLAERAIAECRATLGDDRFEELAAQGAETEWRDLPRPVTSAT